MKLRVFRLPDADSPDADTERIGEISICCAEVRQLLREAHVLLAVRALSPLLH
jgi:hypothetical protein